MMLVWGQKSIEFSDFGGIIAVELPVLPMICDLQSDLTHHMYDMWLLPILGRCILKSSQDSGSDWC